jgi:hypothetical protein
MGVSCYGYGGVGRGGNESGDEDETIDRNVLPTTPTLTFNLQVPLTHPAPSPTLNPGESKHDLNHPPPPIPLEIDPYSSPLVPPTHPRRRFESVQIVENGDVGKGKARWGRREVRSSTPTRISRVYVAWAAITSTTPFFHRLTRCLCSQPRAAPQKRDSFTSSHTSL